MAILTAMVWSANRGQDKVAPPISTPELGPMLPSESPRDDQVLVNIDAPSSSVGTAFAINNTGQWMTARHVVDGCDDIGLKIGKNQTLRVKAAISQEADLAVLSSAWTRPPLPNDLNSSRQIGEAGYFFGFPQGRPGEAIGKLLGRNRMIVRGRYTSDEAILAWSEIGRTNGIFGSLGGLSGGPALDKDGEIIGVVTAESPRRGRIYTVAPLHLRNHIKPQNIKTNPLKLSAYAPIADQLRRDRRIVQVICMVRS
ncbi:MAG: serine protease [Litorimonas sp.]